MDTVLEQKRGFNLRRHTLFDDHILVETKTLQKSERYEVKLETIGWEKFYKSEPTLPAKILFGICAAIPLVLTALILLGIEKYEQGTFLVNWVIWPIFAVLLFARVKNPPDDVYLTGGQRSLLFYRAVPTEPEVTRFMDGVIARSKQYVKEKYAKANPDIPKDVYFGRLQWMKEKEVISESEYQALKIEYDGMRLMD